MNWLWLLVGVEFVAFEVAALMNRRDKFEPATFWLRKLLMLRSRWAPLYWLGLGFYAWLGVHFFVDS
jgi:hypothetical protein